MLMSMQGVIFMFRDITRKNRQLPNEECLEILKNEKRGVLSVIGDEGYPYGMPMNHWYNEADGAIYFHCGKAGHRLDALKRCDKVSFCVYEQGFREEGQWAWKVNSVIVFGRARILTDPADLRSALEALADKYSPNAHGREKEIEGALSRVAIIELTPDEITGKEAIELVQQRKG